MQAITHLPSQSILVAATTIPTTPHTRYASTHTLQPHGPKTETAREHMRTHKLAHGRSNRFHRFLLAVSSTFNSLFKVLFTFPSRYLCAIGFPRIFSFGWNLPPIKTALPSNPTLGKPSVRSGLQVRYGALTLSGATFQWTWTWAAFWRDLHKLQLSSDKIEQDYQLELNLVHSPLLKVSYLVSFPPLIYMLKFSG